ncbi:MAG: SUMF1/EgtB/PvdO family nonheme iron enzyme [Silicimonas sp.]|nr:SUMF1/EgtB/PvdO family nonheme iron enzyme [Silicimonas sp.]
MIRQFLALLILIATPGFAQSPEDWPPLVIDPGAQNWGAADLLLPTPCGGAMAFQRIDVPVNLDSPIADQPFRMGQSDATTAFADYLKPTHLRGAFNDLEAGVSYFYIQRYELNEGQHRAILGDCDAPFTPKDARARGKLSWFDANDIARRYTEWLMANAREDLPGEGDRVGFLRLPTEPEWEYAARGGARADPSVFAARRFFTEGGLQDFAAFRAPGKSPKGPAIIGARRQPNPLGLFDIYGNVEELMLEPFRLNAIGRSHGQAGGLVTRGGSADLEEAQIYTAKRSEYPMYSPLTGLALRGEYFGARFVIGAIVVSDDRFDAIKEGWVAEADRPADAETDPLATLKTLLDGEVDPRRREALSGVQLEFRLAREAAEASLLEAAKSTLLSGATLVVTLTEDTETLQRLDRDRIRLYDNIVISAGAARNQLMTNYRLLAEDMRKLRESRKTFLLSYRSTLEALTDGLDDTTREAAYKAMAQSLDAQEQTQLLDVLNRFWDDLLTYRETPDMDANALLKLAID